MLSIVRKVPWVIMLALLTHSLLVVAPAYGQVVIDWANKKMDSFPQIVDSRMNVTVSVHDVNDLLYQYRIKLVAAPRAIDDAGSLLAVGTAAADANKNMNKENAADACSAGVTKLNSTIDEVTKAIADVFDCSKKKDSMLLAQTVQEWDTNVKDKVKALTGAPDVTGSRANVAQNCTDDGKALGDSALSKADIVIARAAGYQKQIDGLHVVQQSESLDPETNYTVTVTEFCGSKQTKEFTATFTPASHAVTLSLGALLSRIQQRSYASTKDPSNTQQNLLSVNGNGNFSPLAAALINYEIPIPEGEKKMKGYGFAISSGLVLSFGSNNVSASSLGWFGGPSIHLYHRLFITAGVHIGQFTDFPVGLRAGSAIPANYGGLTGPTRPTARFAFGVTYQTKQFSGGSTTAKTNTTGAAK